MTAMKEPRDGYAQALLELGAKHDDVFVLDENYATPNYTIRFRNACFLRGWAAPVASFHAFMKYPYRTVLFAVCLATADSDDYKKAFLAFGLTFIKKP